MYTTVVGRSVYSYILVHPNQTWCFKFAWPLSIEITAGRQQLQDELQRGSKATFLQLLSPCPSNLNRSTGLSRSKPRSISREEFLRCRPSRSHSRLQHCRVVRSQRRRLALCTTSWRPQICERYFLLFAVFDDHVKTEHVMMIL